MQVFHPNIDLDGNICLNILREDWKPVLSINSVIYGLQFLFLVSAWLSLSQSTVLSSHVRVIQEAPKLPMGHCFGLVGTSYRYHMAVINTSRCWLQE